MSQNETGPRATETSEDPDQESTDNRGGGPRHGLGYYVDQAPPGTAVTEILDAARNGEIPNDWEDQR